MSAVESLSNENALALRLLRMKTVPYDFGLWLSGLSSTPLNSIATWIDPNVLRSIEEIIAPNLIDASDNDRIRSTGTDAWIAAILGYSNRRAAELKLNCSRQMMAACLLPLYRSLATGKLPEALEQTRNRLAEMLVLVGIAEELGEDLAQLLQSRGAPETSPYSILKSVLEFDLVLAGTQFRQAARTFGSGRNELTQRPDSQAVPAQLARPRGGLVWSDPQLLWQIAGELLANKAEIVLPRPWADIGVPWTQIGEHWHALTHRLANSTAAKRSSENEELLEFNADDEIVSEMIDDLLAMQADIGETSLDPQCEEPSLDLDDSSRTAGNSVTNQPHRAHGSPVGAPRLDAADGDHQSESEEEFPETDILEPSQDPSISKIAIVEITCNTDSMFLNIMRRQIATARNEGHCYCLVALCVEAEEAVDSERIGVCRSNGLLIWQGKLVNWLAEHPQVHEPFAFVTAEGQLVVAMQDIERTAATNVIREGLVSVLTGKRVSEHGALARIAVPARYFAGIGSVYPNAGFAAEQLIEATWRCLSAAQNQGKATIKSIEVY